MHRDTSTYRADATQPYQAEQPYHLVSGEAVAIDGDRPVVTWNDSGTLRITRFDATGAMVWF